jgi:hypothetical protein
MASAVSRIGLCSRLVCRGRLTRPKVERRRNAIFLQPCRTFSKSFQRSEELDPTPPTANSTTQAAYEGPLTSTFRRLKLFSLSSLGLTTALGPFIFIVESGLPYSARVALASMAFGTSWTSTAMVAWCGKPYVTTLQRIKAEENGGSGGLEMTTFTLFLSPRVTKVSYCPTIIPPRPDHLYFLAKGLR